MCAMLMFIHCMIITAHRCIIERHSQPQKTISVYVWVSEGLALKIAGYAVAMLKTPTAALEKNQMSRIGA